MALIPFGQFLFDPVGEIGRGGLGRVDRIRIVASNCHHPVGSEWARKRMNENWTHIHLARFEREIQAVQTMRHPNIVTCEGQNVPGGERFYMMPIYPSTLRHALARAGSFRWSDVALFGAVIADALHYAHGLGYIHRDLKPENILLKADRNPVVADWGLGYFVHRESQVLQALTRGGMGTSYYCSAEQWATGKCDATGDIYSLGMVLAELVEGRQRAIEAPGVGLYGAVVEETDAGCILFNDLLERMTALTPSRRPPSMARVASELRRCHALASRTA